MEFSDRPEKGIRFGCGFVLGLILGGIGAAGMFYEDGKTIIAVALVVALILGIAALQFGDSFWRLMKHWVWWFH
jgi:hypothetical protein